MATGAEILERTSLKAIQTRHAAAKLYERIRNSVDDVARVAKNAGMPEVQVTRIKEHVFNRLHQRDDGLRRFDPSLKIADAWKRLEVGTHSVDDLTLLKHELFESRFEGILKAPYRTAYTAAGRAAERQATRAAGLEGGRDTGRIFSRGVQGTSAGRAASSIARTGRAGSRAAIRPNEITTFDDFRARSRIGDQLEGTNSCSTPFSTAEVLRRLASPLRRRGRTL